MTDQERIAALEARVAALEARRNPTTYIVPPCVHDYIESTVTGNRWCRKCSMPLAPGLGASFGVSFVRHTVAPPAPLPLVANPSVYAAGCAANAGWAGGP